METIKLGNTEVGANDKCLVFAEIGAMYESLQDMKKLICLCKEAGADAVKIQTFKAENLALPGSEFTLENGLTISQFDFFKQYEISAKAHHSLFKYAEEIDIMMFSTPSHFEDVELLEELGTPFYKTGSDDLTNLPFLKYIGKKNKPVILSTGMSTLSEIETAIHTVKRTGNDQIILMQCTTSYPSIPENANLKVIETLKTTFGLPVGYSDHVPGILPSVLAASMGACAVEKHMTLDRKLKRPDYEVSAEPDELHQIIQHIRMIPVLKGSGIKSIAPSEKKWRRNARKSLVASKNIKKGNLFTENNIGIMRPGSGIHPGHLEFVLGRKALKSIPKHQMISKDMF